MKYVVLVLLLLALMLVAGCSTLSTVKEKREVISFPLYSSLTACKVDTPERPTLRYEPGSYIDIYAATQDLLGDRQLMLGYERRLEAALKSCK